MGGKQKLANAQNQANALAKQSMRQQAMANLKAQRQAQRAAQTDRRFQANQNRMLADAERQSAEALAASQQNQQVRTDYIDDEEAMRRRRGVGGGGGGGGYGFNRPMGSGLGGSPSRLG